MRLKVPRDSSPLPKAVTCVRAASLALAVLLGGSAPMHAATLLRHDFEGANPWTGMAGYFTAGGGTVTATPAYTNVGTIDAAGTSTASGGLQLVVNSSAATGNWTAGLASGVLSFTAPIPTPALGLLTLSFSLSSSSAYPVRVRIESYDNSPTPVRTGGRSTLIFPAAGDFYQRYALDLDKMTTDGPGSFSPAAAKVRISFELDSTANGTGWPVGPAHTLKVDNVNYSTPKYYVKPASIGGSNSKSGLDEANALSSVQAAINKTLSGDNIIVIMEDATPGGNDYTPDTYNGEMVSITKAGVPDAWIVCKNYPGHQPALKSNGWQAFKVHGAAAYVEIRGLIVRGQSVLDSNGDRQINPAYVSDIGKGRSSSSGNGIAANAPAHHVRVADNTMEYFGGANGGSADRLTFENNLIRYNCWWMVYAGSGISFGFATDWEQGANHRLLIRNNTIYGNECMIPWWGNGGTNYSDGNGIIIDSMTAGYTGKTLIQNNVVFNNGGGGIHILKAENVDVVHNTTYHNSASGFLAYPDTDTQSFGSTDGNWIKNVRFANNISFARRNATGSGSLNETAMGVASFDRATIFQNRNIYGGGDNTPLLTGANFSDNTDLGRSYNAASLFLSPSIDGAVADFRLRSAATARNYGAVVTYRGVLDHDGVPRSLTGPTDTGAYQTVTGLAYSPIFTPAAGKYTSSQNVTLTSDTAGAKIVYTINGTVPTVDGAGNATNGVVYSAAIPVAANTTLKAIAWKSGLTTSPAATSSYDFQDLTALPVPLQLYTKSGNGGVPTPGGLFPGTTVIQPVTHTPGALMRYTTNGTDPTATTGTAATYTGYSVTDYATLRYQAYKAGRANSSIETAEVTVRAATGNLADGTTLTTFGAGNIRFVRFHPSAKFSAAYVFARIAGLTGGYRAAIYSETSGAPATRLAVSSLVTNPATGWTAFPLASRVTLSVTDSDDNDLYYWLAIWSDNAGAGIYATSTGGTVHEAASTFSSTWPGSVNSTTTDPDTGAVAGTANYAIYATNAPPNLAPVVNAGPDQAINLPATANLAATVSDDGVPLAPGTVTTAWSKLSGPGTVTFANSTAPATTATFSTPGAYVLRFTARDALLTTTDDVNITTTGSPLLATNTGLVASTNPAGLGESVTFTATVTSGAGTPPGSVTFFDGAATLATGALNGSGTASFTSSTLSIGIHSITAAYAGNASYAASTSAVLAEKIVLPDGTTRLLAVNTGGSAVSGSGFTADAGFVGGTVSTPTPAIDRSAVPYPAPEIVYQSERYGTFSYTLGGLSPSSACLVRLHFSENYWGLGGRAGPGQRFVNVTINGAQRLFSFDIYAAAGAPNKAVVREFATAANASGQVVINFAGIPGSADSNAAVQGLEVFTVTPFDAWRVAAFPPAQLDNSALSGIAADGDHDGSNTLLEYALETNPLVSDTEGLPFAEFDADGHLTLTFFRAQSELTYIVEGSGDLTNSSNWAAIATNPGLVGESVTVTDDTPPEEGPRYLRLKVIR